MTASPAWSPLDDPTADLLSLVSDDKSYDTFIRVCHLVADLNGGLVSVQKVRDLMRAEHVDIDPRRYSAFWSRACRKGGPMVTTTQWDTCTDLASGNGGKPQRLRRWVA